MQITPALLEAVAGRPLPNELDRPVAEALSRHLPAEGVDTPLRVAHFLAQAAHETGGFKHFVELGGPTYCARYDGRADLGNNQPGDGFRFRGRGIFQLTGRANYKTYGAKLGLDLLGKPELAAEPETAVRIACAYWTTKRLNILADKDDVEGITRRVNGGRNGLDDRRACLARAKQHLGAA